MRSIRWAIWLLVPDPVFTPLLSNPAMMSTSFPVKTPLAAGASRAAFSFVDPHRRRLWRGDFVVCVIWLIFVLVSTGTVAASDRLNWPMRTGPALNGHVAEADANGLPTEWSEVPSSNVAWKLELEGFGHSAPVIGHGRIWVTSATKDGKQQFVHSIDQATGKTLHHTLLFENPEPEPLSSSIR